RTNGRVLAGSPGVKNWPAIRSAAEIPPWEGIRLVANRLCELLGALGDLGPAAGPAGLRYACVKMALACSEAQLIAAHEYRGTYRERWERQARVAACFSAPHNALIEAAYRAKLAGGGPGLAPDTGALVAAVLDLAVATLTGFSLRTPGDLAARVRAEAPAAPGLATDLAFYIKQRIRGRSVAPRRAIAEVYAAAYQLVADLPPHGFRVPPAACRAVARRYHAAVQLVSVIPPGAPWWP
ncbi:MAG TPA: hypothetical protein VKY74_12760, partial [Chloroflexia bacterium]|nr:hypothetical protein [Chloroflexia bacterium]